MNYEFLFHKHLTKLKILFTLILTSISFAYIGDILWSQLSRISIKNDALTILDIIILIFFSISSNIILTILWNIIVKQEKEEIDSTKNILIYLKTIIMKYIPFGIFQFAGRHLYYLELQLDHKKLIKLSIFEIISISLISFLNSFLIFEIDNFFIIPIAIILPIVILTLSTKIFFFKILNFKKIIFIYLLIQMFFIFTFFSYFYIFIKFDISISSSFQLFGIISISYLLGLISFGLPGGIGVREASIIALISWSNPNIINASMFMPLLFCRLTFIISDIITWILSSFFWSKFK